VLRAALGVGLAFQGAMCISQSDTWRGIVELVGGVLLTIGFLTPVVTTLVVIGSAATILFSIPACAVGLSESRVSIALAGAILAAVFLMGPGAFSVDASLFGRREIIIPPSAPRSWH
jgi:hypothetical protein